MKKMRGIIFISDVNKAMEHEWFADSIDRNTFDISFVLFKSKNSELFNYLKSAGFKTENYPLQSKFIIPFYVLFFGMRMLFKRPSFVHCHLFQASIIGILAARLAGVKKRIYTRHHADVHHVYFPNAVKYDLIVNRNATHIIAVSENILNILQKMEQVPPEKITIIRHGIPSAIIEQKIAERDIEAMKIEYQLQDNYPVVGVISRFVPEKGIQYIIPAYKKLLADFPNAKLVLANAKGKYEAELKKDLDSLPASSFILIRFENNIKPLFSAFDVFVHVPIDAVCEAFGQVYIEALSLGVPMVCTLSGIAGDLLAHERNTLVCEYKDPESVYLQTKRMLTDAELRKKLVEKGKEDVKEFTYEKKHAKIVSLYLN